MRANRKQISAVLLALAMLSAFDLTADTEADRRWRRISFPILRKHCTMCHNAADKKGGLDLDLFYYVPSVISRGEMFLHLVDLVKTNQMPPSNRPPMPQDEKDSLTALINGILDDVLREPDPGPAVVRRLSNREYAYTVRDLLGVDFDAMRYFPKDGSGGEGFDNQSGSLFMTPLLMERYYLAADTVISLVRSQSEVWKSHVPRGYRPGLIRRWINTLKLATASSTGWSKPIERARASLIPLATKAYRRFLSLEEQNELMDFFGSIYFDDLWRQRDGFDMAMATTMKRMLVSPMFLYKSETNAPLHKPYPISNFELATRLSYFLWSSLPDDSLLQVAYYEDLHDTAVLDREARRMMADDKFKRFSESFAVQWLGVEDALTNPVADPELHPDFTAEIRMAMKREVSDYFHYVFTDRRNLMELLDSDYSLLNESLARHYDVEDVRGDELRPVKVSHVGRGGLLGMGAVLTATSLPTRTSPVLRGQWVLEEILGTPAPPPPPDVPTLEETQKTARDELDVRSLLELHRASPECSGCHDKMDPIGLAMENFDAVGKWRQYYRGNTEIISTTQLDNGVLIDGPTGLKEYLSQEKEKFAKTFSRKMLSYAMGRGIVFTDTRVLKHLTDILLESDFDSEALVLALVNSYPFKNRRSDMTELYIKQ